LLSPSERKIDHIEERLASIEQLLRTLAANSGSGKSVIGTPASFPTAVDSSDISQAATAAADSLPEFLEHEPDITAAFEGNSSLSAHTAFASELLASAVERTSLGQGHATMADALASLKHIVALQQQPNVSAKFTFPHQKPMPRAGFKALPMPPGDVVVKVLRGFRG